ncbi:hypothetical protein ACOMHN_057410 [Nucella lapillus]
MDDYREQLIELVRARPLLWDPHVADYKDKDQKAQVWENLNGRLNSPTGTTATDVWISLIRCHNNALARKKKKSGSGADKSKPWKFMEQMEFLIPIKDVRTSKGNLAQLSDEESDPKEGDILQTAMDDADIRSDDDGVVVPEEAVAVAERRTGSEKEKRKPKKRKDEDNDELILSLLKKKIKRKSESTRMGFFTSIMPRVDALDDEQFQEFQLQTLQLLKNLHIQKTQQQQFSF